jgi:ATP adenylyltransferase
MDDPSSTPPPNDLRARVRRQLQRARESGDLQPTPTELHEVVDGGVRFQVRVIQGRDHKWSARARQREAGEDPFLPPYRDALFVADLSETHVALLNKFPVLDDHLLIVTRADEPQQSWLGPADFEALALCRAGMDAFAFYNGGVVAGSSQPHKHLQLVPMPVTTLDLFDAGDCGFALAQTDLARGSDGPAMFAAYRELMERLGLDAERDPYNLLLAADRMIVVPRSRHDVQGVFLNAMGYAGSFLVRSPEQLDRLRAIGPRRILAEAGVPDRA